MFVVANDFLYEPYALPSKTVTGNNLTFHINKYEEELLKKVLGLRMYKQFIAGIPPVNAGVVDPKWTKLMDGAEYEVEEGGKKVLYEWKGLKTNKGALVPYLYAMWVRDNFDQLNNTGSVSVSKDENSDNIPPDLRIVQAYNAMSRMIGNRCELRHTLYGFLQTFTADYPDWVFTDPGKMNQFNL